MISQYQLTYIEAAEAAAAKRSPPDQPWLQQWRQVNGAIDSTEHTASSSTEEPSDRSFAEEIEPKDTTVPGLFGPQTTRPMTQDTKRSATTKGAVRVPPIRPNQSVNLKPALHHSNPKVYTSTVSLESKLMKQYKISYRAALKITDKAKSIASRSHNTVERICHDIINGIESDFRTVKLLPVRQGESRKQETVKKETFATPTKFTSIEKITVCRNKVTNAEAKLVDGRARTTSEMSAPEPSPPMLDFDQNKVKQAILMSGKKEGASELPPGQTKLAKSPDLSVDKLEPPEMANRDRESSAVADKCAKSSRSVSTIGAVPAARLQIEETDFKASTAESGMIDGYSSLPESLLIQQYRFGALEAYKIVEEARITLGIPHWIPSTPSLTKECERLAEIEIRMLEASHCVLKADSSKAKRVPSLTSILETSPKAKQLESSEKSKPDDVLTTNPKPNEDLKTNNAGESLTEHRIPPQTQSLVCPSQMTRPLETVLAQRHNITWQQARSIVQKGRLVLDMTQGTAWTPELERFCEDACVSLCGKSLKRNHGNSDTLSVVYSVDIKDLSKGGTEIGKSWVSHSIDDCSLVSRCPSRTQEKVFIEAETESFTSLTSDYTPHSEPFDVPCLIFVQLNEAPEVPMDEPLEAVLGIPFLRRRGTPKRKQADKRIDGPRASLLLRTFAKIKSKTTGRLSENSSECYRETLVEM